MKFRSTIESLGWNRRRAFQDLVVLSGTFLLFIWIAYEFSLFGAATASLDSAKRIDLYETLTASALLFCGIWVFALRRGNELRAEVRLRTAAEARAANADFRANHDPLTGLGNRSKFDETLAALTLADETHQEPKRSTALLLLDLNGFKRVNDQYGHPFGDEVLQIIARRLGSNTRETDQVCRLGGDEFAVISPKPGFALREGRASAEVIAETIIDTIDQPIVLNGRTIEVGVAIGIAYYPETAVTARDLVAKADKALYAAKEKNLSSSRSTYVVSS